MDERTPGQTTFRVMGPHERGRFAPDAWGHLLSLNGSGAINGPELEHIIERALMQFEGSADFSRELAWKIHPEAATTRRCTRDSESQDS